MNPIETAKGLFFEGLKFLEAGDLAAAETKFAQALELLPERPSILVNLSAVKIRLGKLAEAEELARCGVKADPKSPEAWANLGDVLAATKRHHEAVQAYDLALDSDAGYAKAWQNKSSSLLALERHQDALAACDRARQLAPGQPAVLLVRSQALRELGREPEARAAYSEYVRTHTSAAPIHHTARTAGQRGKILILVPNPTGDINLPPVDFLYRFAGNYPTQLAERLAGEFHFSFMFRSDVARLPGGGAAFRPDVVINNNGNGDLIQIEDSLPQLTRAADFFSVPVVNHPSKVAQTTRENMVRLLRDIPDVVLPKTRRFHAAGRTADAVIREIEAEFEYPLITRTVVSQQGVEMTRFASRAELAEKMALGCPDVFYVTEFVDTRGGGEIYRKIRAAFVQDQMVIMRVGASRHWKVHGRTTDAEAQIFLDHRHLLEEEKQICADPEKMLGRPAIRALRAMRERIPLDIFGMDFNVAPDGRVVFFEANACMKLLASAGRKVPYSPEADAALLQLCRNYLDALVAGR